MHLIPYLIKHWQKEFCTKYTCCFAHFISVLVTYPIDIAFAISATSTKANELYDYMKDAIRYIIDKYGMYYVHYAFMVFGSEPDVQVTFGDSFNSTDPLKSLLDNIARLGGQPNLDKALEKASELFQPGYEGERPGVHKFLAVIVDRDIVGDENVILRHAKNLENSEIKVSSSVLCCNRISWQFLYVAKFVIIK